MLETIQALDASVMLFIQESVRGDFLDKIMVFFTNIGEAGTIWIIISLILIATKRYRKAGFIVLISMGICYLFNDVLIKNIVMRQRPFVTVENLTPLVSPPSSYSFPSGHACSSFVSAYALTKSLGKNGGFFYIPAVIIAASRPYVGVHYLSDIIVGALLGTLGGILLFKPLSIVYKKLNKIPFFNTDK